MTLTSLTLLTMAGLTTVAVIVGLALLWRRLTGHRLAIRVLGIMLAETLLVLTVALVINRAGDFYPTWAALTAPPIAVAGPGGVVGAMRPRLASLAPHGGQAGLVMQWPGHINDPEPMVWLPPAYFRQPQRLQPVVVVIAAGDATAATGAWNGNDVAPVVGRVPGCVVFVRLGPHTDPGQLAATLPGQLAHGLGVADHAWGVLAIGPAAPAGHQLFTTESLRFTAFATTGEPGAATLSSALMAMFARIPPALSAPTVVGAAPTGSPPPVGPSVQPSPVPSGSVAP